MHIIAVLSLVAPPVRARAPLLRRRPRCCAASAGPATDNAAPLGVSFSAAGLLFPYHLGAASALERAGLLQLDSGAVPLAGASAGALAAASLGAGVPIAEALAGAKQVAADVARNGAAGRLDEALLPTLTSMLPADAHDLLNARAGRVTVAFAPLGLPLRGTFASAFSSRDDVVECLLASCCIPFYFNGGAVRCRGELAVDGFFACPPQALGCPRTGALRDVRVTFPGTPLGVFDGDGGGAGCIRPVPADGTGRPSLPQLLRWAGGAPPPSAAEADDLFAWGAADAEAWLSGGWLGRDSG